ncbi:hypothetical protein D9M70_501380 [compost metagenome]
MVEAGAGKHEAVEVCDGQAGRLARRQVAQHAAGAAAVPVEVPPFTPEERRRAEGLAVDDIGDVGECRRVEQPVHRLVVVETTVMAALDAVDRIDGVGGRGMFGHGWFLSGLHPEGSHEQTGLK